MVARAIARQPQLLLLDEPTLGVDVGSRADIYATLEGLTRDGATILVGSQDEQELIQYASQIWVLSGHGLVGPIGLPYDRHQLVELAARAARAPLVNAA